MRQGCCAYCGCSPAVHNDHIVPKALRRRHPGWESVTVRACMICNVRKGTRRLVPPSWADRIYELPGTKPWMVWDGDPLKLRAVLR
jgi:5-methylcytosine-specific restriction endonuclease McrA